MFEIIAFEYMQCSHEKHCLLKGEVSKVAELLVLHELYDSKRAVDRLLGAELCDSTN